MNAPPASATPPPGGGAAAAPGAMQDNVASTLCYVLGLLTGILFLVLAPYNTNRNVRFHAFQAIFMHVGVLVCWVVLIVAAMGLHVIPILGSIISFLLWMGFSLGVIAVWLYCLYKAYNGERFLLPIVGPLAEKQANA